MYSALEGYIRRSLETEDQEKRVTIIDVVVALVTSTSPVRVSDTHTSNRLSRVDASLADAKDLESL